MLVLVGILLLGAGLFFVDGALTALVSLGGALTRYIPWLAGSAAALLAVCYLGPSLVRLSPATSGSGICLPPGSA